MHVFFMYSVLKGSKCELRYDATGRDRLVQSPCTVIIARKAQNAYSVTNGVF